MKRRRSARGLEAAERRVLARRSALLQRDVVLLCVLPLPCGLRSAFLRRLWLRQQPRGSLRRPRRDRGIASSPYSLLGFSGTPLYRRRSAEGLEAAERCVLTRRSAAGARVWCVALRSAVDLRLSWRPSCAAFGCGSSRVAASGGQGGPGGLRFPPRPSLDSPLPLETPPLR